MAVQFLDAFHTSTGFHIQPFHDILQYHLREITDGKDGLCFRNEVTERLPSTGIC